MKFRIAKKIMGCSSSYHKRCWELRPPFINEEGRTVRRSPHDIDRIVRARKVFMHHVKKNKKKPW